MTYYDHNPIDLYRDLKARIPSIKIKNKNFMNKLHSLNMPSDFWWAISGEYAILAEKADILSSGDPRFLNDLQKYKYDFPPNKVLSNALMDSVGKDFIIDKDFDLYSKIIRKKNTDELLFDDESKHYINEINIGHFPSG